MVTSGAEQSSQSVESYAYLAYDRPFQSGGGEIVSKEERISRLSELLKDVSGLIRDINELENKTEPAGEKEAKN